MLPQPDEGSAEVALWNRCPVKLWPPHEQARMRGCRRVWCALQGRSVKDVWSSQLSRSSRGQLSCSRCPARPNVSVTTPGTDPCLERRCPPARGASIALRTGADLPVWRHREPAAATPTSRSHHSTSIFQVHKLAPTGATRTTNTPSHSSKSCLRGTQGTLAAWSPRSHASARPRYVRCTAQSRRVILAAQRRLVRGHRRGKVAHEAGRRWPRCHVVAHALRE